ncbi:MULTISPECIES: hypothetical protein [Crateriforma]|nr:MULTISPECIES: hypothetical protein [Crateriforma]
MKHGSVSPARIASLSWLVFAALGFVWVTPASSRAAESASATSLSHPVAHAGTENASAGIPNRSDPGATKVIDQVLKRLMYGPAFNAQIRKRVWTSGREVIGVGLYEQAGQGTGHYNLQVTMHDGAGKHTLQQISDGRLAWTRTEIAGSVVLKRVDVRILQQRIRDAGIQVDPAPHLVVGGLVELVESIQRDYDLTLQSGKFKLKSSQDDGDDEQTFLVLSGELKSDVRETILKSSGRDQWPSLCPTSMRMLIATQGDTETDFGRGLPRRIYFFSDPPPAETKEGEAAPTTAPDANVVAPGHLISLIELYALKPITAPSPDRFSFESQDQNNHYVNETQRYLKRYGL